MKPLPVDNLLPRLTQLLGEHPTIVLEAPPGSGKTTRVAPSLIESGLCDSSRRTFLLQPRRVAARATATRIASEQSWQLGSEVGYQVRFENRCSDSTPLVVATEGILLRRISDDPTLADIGTVILDEFHERSLNADLLLGMLRRIQQVVREDLKLIVMSATLNTQMLAETLDAPVLSTPGTLYPVNIKYRPPRSRADLHAHVVETVLLTLEKTPGDILVFLPGVGEISRAQNDLEKQSALRDCEVLPLHGSLPLEQQNKVLTSRGKRRVVLATNVAETSLTIEGINTVIDSGQVRVLRFQPDVALDRLLLEPICQSSAEQRAGRAGRLAEGSCIRLWTEQAQRARPTHLDPEIRRVDLSAATLQLLSWGETPEGDFPWLEPPREEALAIAKQTLERLGATSDGQITDLGRRLAALPIAPRLGRMLIEAESFNAVDEVSIVAAMISERDPFLRPDHRRRGSAPPTRSNQRWNCDVTQRYLALVDFYENGTSHSEVGEIHRGSARNVRRVAEQLERSFSADASRQATPEHIDEIIQRCLLAAFPDRLARRRKPSDAKGRMVGGRGVRLVPSSGVQAPEFFLCVDVDAGKTDATVRLASGVDLAWLDPRTINTREEQFFNPTRKQVEARKRSYFQDLLLAESPISVSDEEQCRRLLLSEAKKNLSEILPPKDAAFSYFLTRLACLREWMPELELPAPDDNLLLEVAEELSVGKRSFAELKSAPWADWFSARLTPEQQTALEKECPERIQVPTGNHIKLTYELGKPPVLAVRIQEIFSWTDTPRIAGGRVPVLLHLLAPNMRPQQVTDDLASFWANTYEVVRKELRRRYPKHAWPEDPRNAKPIAK